MRVNGKWGKCMERVNSYGKMDKDMRVTIKMVRDKVMEFITTKMVLDMKVNGQKVYRMVQVK